MLENNSKNLKLSIITVCFNEEKNIEETCKSVVSQDFADFEWIVIDGFSEDKTLEILNKYKSKISVLVSLEKKGVYNAMNEGIKLAKGEYVLFLNGGDSLYEKDVLKKVFGDKSFLGEILYGNCCVVQENGLNKILDYSQNLNKYYFLKTCINHQSTFIKKELFDKFGLYDENYRILGDYEKWLCFLKNKVNFQKLPFVVSNFKGFGGLSSSQKTKNLTLKEKREIINKYFTNYEVFIYKLFSYFIGFLVFFKSGFREIINIRKFTKKYYHKILNSKLRQPARKVWYFLRGKK